MLRTVPLQSLVEWLSKPKGPNLVEASVAVATDKALALAVTKRMLYAGEPMSPLSFRGFRLHSIWTQQPGGELTHQITFCHFLGKSSLSLLKYES